MYCEERHRQCTDRDIDVDEGEAKDTVGSEWGADGVLVADATGGGAWRSPGGRARVSGAGDPEPSVVVV